MIGCIDSGCVFGRRTGRVTNGGCKCLIDVRYPTSRLRLRNQIASLARQRVDIIDTIRAHARDCGCSARILKEIEEESSHE